MGVYIVYDEFNGKWKVYGSGTVCEWFDTEEEAKANYERLWQEHNEILRAHRFVASLLKGERHSYE